MSSDVTLQVRIDSALKERAEQPVTGIKNRIGIAKGEFIAPDDIDFCNDEIAKMFGVD